MMASSEYRERKAHQLQRRLLLLGDQMLLKEELLTVALRSQKENIHSQDQLSAHLLEEKALREEIGNLQEWGEDLKKELLSLSCGEDSPPSPNMTEPGDKAESSGRGEEASPSNRSMREDLISGHDQRPKRVRRDSGGTTPPALDSPSTIDDTHAASGNVYEAFKHTPRQSWQQGWSARRGGDRGPVHPYDIIDDVELNVDGNSLNIDSLHLLESLGWRRKRCCRIIPLQKRSSTVYLPPGQTDPLSGRAEKNKNYFLTIAAARYFHDGGRYTDER